MLFRLTANVGIPATRERDFSLYFQDEFAYTEMPNFAQTIGGKEAFNGMSVWFDVSYFLSGNGDLGGFYLLGGLGLSLFQINYTPDDFDKTLYYSDFDDLTRTSYFFPVMRFGTGYEFGLSFANLYVQGYINLPASRDESNVDGSPFSVGTTVGLCFPFRKAD